MILHAEANIFSFPLVKVFIKNLTQTVYFHIDFLSTVTQAFVLSRCEAEQHVVVWALVGCNLSWVAVCGNYLLHGSAVGNCYLYPGCQTIGFPSLTLSDIR